MRFIFFCFLLSSFCCLTASAQHDSTPASAKNVLNPVDPKTVNPFLPDSVERANHQKLVYDSVAMAYLVPDSAKMRSRVMDSIMKPTTNEAFLLQFMSAKKTTDGVSGKVRPLLDPWVIGVIIGLLIYTGLLNLFFGADLKSVLQSFYNKHSLSQTDKEAGLINSWAFIGLVVLFCLALGMVLYLLAGYYGRAYPASGPQLFLSLSAIIGVLIALKVVILKFVGFIFDISSLVSEYIAVLNLTYFNLAFLLLGVVVCFGLLASRFIPLLLTVTLGATGVILVWQYLRNSMSIISDFRFHKFYLFVYLCALEICPVLILIKALDI